MVVEALIFLATWGASEPYGLQRSRHTFESFEACFEYFSNLDEWIPTGERTHNLYRRPGQVQVYYNPIGVAYVACNKVQ